MGIKPGLCGSYLARTFASLRIRNYRLYFFGQTVSITGQWMWAVALAWLVLQETHDGLAVGAVTTCQYLPLLVLGPFAGSIIDRVDRLNLLFATQGLMAVVATSLWILTMTGNATTPVLFAHAAAFGLIQPFDNPARRVLVYEMVGVDLVTNAVALNSATITVGRVAGPAFGGVILASSGASLCFLLNALSYAAILAALLLMRRSEMISDPPTSREAEPVRAGFRYALRTPNIFWPLFLTGSISLLLMSHQVILPLLARRSFGGNAALFGVMFACLSVGSVIGALLIANRRHPQPHTVLVTAVAFALATLAVGASPAIAVTLVLLVFLGVADQGFSSVTAGFIQIATDSRFRGRVVALFSSLYIGSQAVSGLVTGGLAQQFGPRAALVIVAIGGLATVAYTARRWNQRLRESQDLATQTGKPSKRTAGRDRWRSVASRKRGQEWQSVYS